MSPGHVDLGEPLGEGEGNWESAWRYRDAGSSHFTQSLFCHKDAGVGNIPLEFSLQPIRVRDLPTHQSISTSHPGPPSQLLRDLTPRAGSLCMSEAQPGSPLGWLPAPTDYQHPTVVTHHKRMVHAAHIRGIPWVRGPGKCGSFLSESVRKQRATCFYVPGIPPSQGLYTNINKHYLIPRSENRELDKIRWQRNMYQTKDQDKTTKELSEAEMNSLSKK